MENSDATGTQIVKYSYETGEKVGVIATAMDIFGNTTKTIEGYSFSADERQLLIETDVESIYRHSYTANYYVYNIETKRTFPLTNFDEGKQRLAEFSPDGTLVAFVRNNNLFFVNTTNKHETQVTQDGEMNKIINGATDWVYEEEFGFDKGFRWSPNGDRIAYYRFDESKVREFGMDIYGSLYPERELFKYPKAGEKNSVVKIHIYDVNNGMHRQVDTGTNQDQYIPGIKWSQNNDKLCVMRMNRHQNQLEFLLTDMAKAEPFTIGTTVIFKEEAASYIDISESLLFLKDGSGFVWTSERDEFNHLYLFDMTGAVKMQITQGPWDVVSFYGMDEENGVLYYSSSERGAHRQDVFSINIKKKKKEAKMLSSDKGMNSAEFSHGFKYYINTYSNANTPMTQTLHSTNGKLIRVLKDNKGLKDRLVKYNLTEKEFFTFTNSEGIELNCWMMKPKNFDSSKKYPVLVAIYGGPGHNTVMDQWEGRGYMWHQMLCQEGYIVMSVDPRGTQFRGRKFKHATYMNLGKYETIDFIDFAKHLGTKDYVDANRIGMQGWSFGGYMTSSCMFKGSDVYKAGIAVAPVTNWKYYDSIYTERFMRTPAENDGGYENNSPINFAAGLKGKFLLVHGSADDNVHYQNTMDLVTALVKANKQFDMFIYPNKNHGISGGNTRLHLYTKMTDFLKANL